MLQVADETEARLNEIRERCSGPTVTGPMAQDCLFILSVLDRERANHMVARRAVDWVIENFGPLIDKKLFDVHRTYRFEASDVEELSNIVKFETLRRRLVLAEAEVAAHEAKETPVLQAGVPDGPASEGG